MLQCGHCVAAVGPPLLFPLYFQYRVFKHPISRGNWVVSCFFYNFYHQVSAANNLSVSYENAVKLKALGVHKPATEIYILFHYVEMKQSCRFRLSTRTVGIIVLLWCE